MESIVLPERVVLRLVNLDGTALRIPNVLFTVRAFARRKNDFDLGPFVSSEEGVVSITKSELLAEANAHSDSGLMDYERIENCKPEVVIDAMTPRAIDKALESRAKVWTMLLGDEAQRWGTLENLRNTYRKAANSSISVKALSARWDGTSPEYEYSAVAQKR
jgi:hypothetical protein